MMAKLNGMPLRSSEGDRRISERKTPGSLNEFVYIAISAVPMSSVVRQVRANNATLTQGNFCGRDSSNNMSADESNELLMKPLILLQLHLVRAVHTVLSGSGRRLAHVSSVPSRVPRHRGRKLERLQVLAWFETHGFSGRDVDFRTGPRVSSDACLPRLHREHTEAPQLNPIIGLERILHAIEDRIHRLFCFRLAHSRPLDDLVHKIEFDHWGPPYLVSRHLFNIRRHVRQWQLKPIDGYVR